MPFSLIVFLIAVYFLILIFISRLTSKNAGNDAFFIANRKSPWFVVAFGMIGASLSGVTFISVPGWVGSNQFAYMQIIFGYVIGYFIIAGVLLPLYYKLNLITIYSYLKKFGFYTYKTGAFFFLLSRTIGTAFRLFLIALVMQILIFDNFNIPFSVTVGFTILLIWLYTRKGGIKTIIWTDTLQTFFMLVAVVVCIITIASDLNISLLSLPAEIKNSGYSKMFFFDPGSSKFFWKEFTSGIFIAIVMTGLDQDMMQKNLTCKNIGEAQKNMITFSIVQVFVNFLFVVLGAMLFMLATAKNLSVPEMTDYFFPTLAVDGHLQLIAGIFFVLGVIAAAYSSADSALTSLTTSLCIDVLDIDKKSKEGQVRLRKQMHIVVAVAVFAVIMIFKSINNENVITAIFTAAGYTYGPLLGLFAYGLFVNKPIYDRWVPFIAISSPLICFILQRHADTLLWGYQFGFELLILNGLLTFTGLLFIMKNKSKISQDIIP
ncbi:MAG: sodium:solute symporter [Chitinophagaceae bacterium]|nr:MAG: sodium:solute symporter [Chitinophagaceae bacterium]